MKKLMKTWHIVPFTKMKNETLNVTLLNGERWDHASLLHEMQDDQFYYGHLGQHCLSSTACKMLLDSPKSYYYQKKYGSEEKQSFNIGRMTHMMALEPHKFDMYYEVVPVQSRATKKFKEHISDREKITQAEYNEAIRLSNAVLRNDQVVAMFKNCEFEVPQIGIVDDLPFRSKADIYDMSGSRLLDLKTTTNLKAFKVSADKYGYDLQCYLYCQLFDVPFDRFQFIAVDKQSLDLGIYNVSESFFMRGKAKLERAIATYKTFFIEMEDLDSYTIRETLE